MSNYKFPPRGPLDPIDALHHYIGSSIGGLILDVKDGEPVDWAQTRHVLSGLMKGFSNGTYMFPYSQSFNPAVAGQLRADIEQVIREGASVQNLEGLCERILAVADRYAVETGQPGSTRAAIAELRTRLKAEQPQ